MVGVPLSLRAQGSAAGHRSVSASALFINIVSFQLAWFGAVLGAAAGLPWLGVLCVSVACSVHLARAVSPRLELCLLGIALAVGIAFENLLVGGGLLSYDDRRWLAGAAPGWMVALWAGFAMTLNVSLRALRTRLALAAVLGAAGAPLAYLAGSRLGAVDLGHPYWAPLVIGAGWLVLTPLLVIAARRFDGYAPR
jgi:hypothetical protein